MLKIGEFSKLAQVSVKTLRYYAELGLLKPDWVDRYTGYRYYTLQQLLRANRASSRSRTWGFSLVQIERLLQVRVDELRRLMQLRQAELEEEVRAEQMRLDRKWRPGCLTHRAGRTAAPHEVMNPSYPGDAGGGHPRHGGRR
ncbi:MAG: MerR family DNA-binding transcriptional regulator [Caldilineaceae bacterium]